MTRAIILAAGQGTRLRPLTDDKPKCLVPLLGKSLLERQINILHQNEIKDILIATGYRADQIKSLGYSTSFNARFFETNMVESLFCAMDFIRQEGELIIAYGDIIYQSKNLEAILSCNDEIALMIDSKWKDLWSLRLENPLDDAETLLIDKNGFVIELGKKPDGYDKIQGQYTGLIKIRGDKLSDFIRFYEKINRAKTYDGRDFNNMYMTSFLQLLINDGWKTKAVLVNNGWLEVDSIDDLVLYENMAQKGILDKFIKLDD